MYPLNLPKQKPQRQRLMLRSQQKKQQCVAGVWTLTAVVVVIQKLHWSYSLLPHQFAGLHLVCIALLSDDLNNALNQCRLREGAMLHKQLCSEQQIYLQPNFISGWTWIRKESFKVSVFIWAFQKLWNYPLKWTSLTDHFLLLFGNSQCYFPGYQCAEII